MLAKARRKVQWLVNDALFALGWRKAGRLLAGPGRRLLVYHGICPTGQPYVNGRFLTVDRFESQVRFLREHAQLVSLDDYFSGNFDPQRFAVAITFDDGYRNNLRYALPVLEKYAAPAAFFLTSSADRGADWLWTDFLDVATLSGPEKLEIDGRVFYRKKWRHTRFYADAAGRKLAHWARYSPWTFVQALEKAFLEAGAWRNAEALADFWQLLTPEEVRVLAASPLATIGAHGHTHQDLAVLTHEEACRELQTCKAVLEKWTGREIRALAYPFGAYTRELLDFAEKIGYSQQLASDFRYPHDRSDARLRDRLTVNPFISDNNQLVAVRKGRY